MLITKWSVQGLGSLGTSPFFGKAWDWETRGADMSALSSIRAALRAFWLEKHLWVGVKTKTHQQDRNGVRGIASCSVDRSYLKVWKDTTKILNNSLFFDHIRHVTSICLRFASILLWLYSACSAQCISVHFRYLLLFNLNPCETEPVFTPQKFRNCGCHVPAVNVALEHSSMYTMSCITAGRCRDLFELKLYGISFLLLPLCL